MHTSPRVTVAAVITDAQGRHLLVEEAPDGVSVFNQPAGHLEPGETLLEGAIREVHEETCRRFTPRILVGIYQWTHADAGTYLRFCFAGSVSEPLADCSLDPDIIANHWVAPEQLGTRLQPRSPMVQQCIRDFTAGSAYPLDVLHALTD